MNMTLRLHHLFRTPLRRQQGFTLVEMAIVLVIIGLLLGGIVKGGSLIQEMQVKDVMTTIKDLQTSSQYFKERYHYLPGDCVAAACVIPNVTVTHFGNGDGLIDAVESGYVPEHLFNAGYIRGGTGTIQTQYGTVTVISRAASHLAAVLPTSIQNVIEFANLPCDVATEIDRKIDDGNLTTGNVMATGTPCVSGSTVPYFAVGL
jgi:prepilin-type N-terminal cleavage/methylation domain-containing protein